MTTGEDINNRMKIKEKDEQSELAMNILEKMGVKNPLPYCYIHEGNFTGAFIEYPLKNRTVVKVCFPCIFKILDAYLDSKGENG